MAEPNQLYEYILLFNNIETKTYNNAITLLGSPKYDYVIYCYYYEELVCTSQTASLMEHFNLISILKSLTGLEVK